MLEPGLGSGYLNLRPKVRAFFLVKIASIAGYELFDTAQLYAKGKGERLLGILIPEKKRIVTKIGWSAEYSQTESNEVRWRDHFPAEKIELLVDESLLRLRRERCFGLLLHSISADVNLDEHIFQLERLKGLGRVEKIGFSIDSIDQLPKWYGWADIIEIPISLVDQIKFDNSTILVLNGLFRETNKLNQLFTFHRNHPSLHIIALIGSGRLIRVLKFIFKIKSGSN